MELFFGCVLFGIGATALIRGHIKECGVKNRISALVILILSIALLGTQVQSEDAAAQSQSSLIPVVATEEQKKVFDDFQRDIINTATKTDEAFTTYMEMLSKGNANLYKIYNITNQLQEANQQAMLIRVNIPNALSKDVKKLLEDSMSDFSTGHYEYENGYKKIKTYIDSNKMSDLQKAKDNFEYAKSFMASGTSKFAEAKTKMGIQ